jgi:aspartate/methionine/tyrosine aminotransferase
VKPSPASNVPASKIRAIAALADEHPGTLRLFVGEDSRPTPDYIKEAAKRAIDADKTYYTPNAGYAEVRRAVADHLADLHGIEVDPARQVVITSSGMNAILLAIQATVGAGDSAIVLTPLWPNTAAAIRVAGAEAIEVPLEFRPEGYRLDFDRLEAAVRPDTRLLALASPGNPTGWTATAEDWRTLVAFCERHGLWLLADSVYERIVYEGRTAPSPLAIPEARPRTILVQSLSKAYRMTGWRLGYAVAPPALGPLLANLQEFVVSNAPGVVQEAARAAILDGEPFIAEIQARYARNLALALERLGGLDGVELARTTGAFYLFPRLRGLSDSFGFCERMVREHRLGLAPGAAFGRGGEGHVRICFAVEEPILVEALDRFVARWEDCLEPAAAAT